MTEEQKLFAKLSDEIKSKFDSIGDEKVKVAVTAAFGQYETAYKAHTTQELKVINENIEKINKSLGELDGDQAKKVSTMLTSIEEKLSKFETTLREQGKKITKGMIGNGIQGKNNAFDKEITSFLEKALPLEDGKVIYEALEGRQFSVVSGEIPKDAKTNANYAVISTASMFAALDPMTNANTTAGQAISRDVDVMGFRNIPPILNDHVADIFMTPKMGIKAYMTLRIFHTFVDGVGIKAEGAAAFGKSSVQLKSFDYKVFTYGTSYKISVEENEDVPEIVAELNAVIPDLMLADLDEKILSEGGDNTTTPIGALNTVHANPNALLFNPFVYAGSNSKADVADVVAKMKLYAASKNYRVNGVLAHDNFYDNYGGLRDSNGNSIVDRRVQFSPTGEITGMSGLATRKNKTMKEFAVLVSATPSEIIGMRENIMMQVGLNGTDFADHNISTKFWGRFAYGAKDPSANIYTPDFVEAIAILSMSAATALTYTDEVAKSTSGYEQENITISLLKTAGCISLVDTNEAAYQVAINDETGIADLSALQAVISINL